MSRAHAHRLDRTETMEEFNWLSRSKGDGQQRATLQVCDIAGINLTFGGSIDEVGYFQDVLPDYTLTVFDDKRGTSIAFEGPPST